MQIREMPESDQNAWVHDTVQAISGLLTPGEELLYVAMQDQRAPTIKKHAVIATTKRLILFRPQMVGSFNFVDAQWQDVQEVHLKQGMLFSDFNVLLVSGKSETVEKLNKDAARKVYAIAQGHEQEWREKRRERKMEEERARAGGITIQGGTQSGASTASQPQRENDPVARLARAKTMMDQGLIGDDEYNAFKERILSEI